MIVISTQYPGKTTAPSGNYPQGSAKNITIPGDGTGTPWELSLLNDFLGFQQAVVLAAGITPSGNPDTAVASDVLDGIVALQGFRNPKLDGATGDGATDDTVAIQDTIDALPDGGGIALSAGTYLVSNIVMKSNITFLGLGGILTQISATNTEMIDIPVGSSNIVLEGLRLEGNFVNNTSTAANVGLITVKSTNGSPSTNIAIRNCTISNFYRDGIALQDGCADIRISGNIIDYSDQAAGINLCVTGGDVENVLCSGNTVTQIQTSNISAPGILKSVRILDNHLGLNDEGLGSTVGDSIQAFQSANENVIISGNTLVGSIRHGIYTGGENIIIENNDIREPTLQGIRVLAGGASPAATSDNCKIHGNDISGATFTDGIFTENAKRVKVSGNTLAGGSGDGIRVIQDTTTDAGDGFTISENNVEGFTGRAIYILGDINDAGINDNVLQGLSAQNGIEFGDTTDAPTRIAIVGNTIGLFLVSFKENNGSFKNLVVANILLPFTTAATQLGAGSDTFVTANKNS